MNTIELRDIPEVAEAPRPRTKRPKRLENCIFGIKVRVGSECEKANVQCEKETL